jgi:hypothetical protein
MLTHFSHIVCLTHNNKTFSKYEVNLIIFFEFKRWKYLCVSNWKGRENDSIFSAQCSYLRSRILHMAIKALKTSLPG